MRVRKKIVGKRFHVISANCVNKQDIPVTGYNRYTQIKMVRKSGQYKGKKLLKVTTLWNAYDMRVTHFQNLDFYVKIQRELVLADKAPEVKFQKSSYYDRIMDLEAAKKFTEYLNTIQKNPKPSKALDEKKSNLEKFEEIVA
jgi:hypothetical protein